MIRDRSRGASASATTTDACTFLDAIYPEILDACMLSILRKLSAAASDDPLDDQDQEGASYLSIPRMI